jgi:hypothetical protein
MLMMIMSYTYSRKTHLHILSRLLLRYITTLRQSLQCPDISTYSSDQHFRLDLPENGLHIHNISITNKMHYSVFYVSVKKYIINSVGRVVGYLYVIELINPRKLEQIKTSHIL